MTKRVLVTDCWTRKALSVVRSLGEEGIIVHAVAHTRLGAALYSKHTHKYSILTSPERDKEKYWIQLVELLKKWEFDCILPLEEESIEVLLKNKDALAKLTKSPYMDSQAYTLASNKWDVYQLAKELGIPAPHSTVPASDEDVNLFVSKNGFPIIFKPISGRGSAGIKTIENEDQLATAMEGNNLVNGQHILQQKLPTKGQGLGVSSLVKDGETLCSFSYKRLREYPVNGGPSTLRESTNDETTKHYAAQLLKALKWDGIAMVEFKHDSNANEAKLLEINPRFWGSLELAHSAGINFPILLYKLLMDLDIPDQKYETGRRCRWLIPGDIVHFLANKKRFSMEPSFFNFFNRNTTYDQLSWKDIRGSLATLACTFLSAFQFTTWRKGIFRK